MGGRGSSSQSAKNRAKGGSADGVIAGGAPRTIETVYIEGRGWHKGRYKDTVLTATTDGDGNLSFDFATPVTKTKTAKTNKTNYITYEVQAGAVNGKMFGVDLTKAKSVSGQTFDLKGDIKAAGFKWNGAKKRWERV